MRGSQQKKRRLEPEEESTVIASRIKRDDSDIRASSKQLYHSLSEYGDVLIVVQGSESTREFPCVSAVLAAAASCV